MTVTVCRYFTTQRQLSFALNGGFNNLTITTTTTNNNDDDYDT